MLITRVHGVRAVIGRIPSGFGPDLYCGELRYDDDHPWRFGARVGPFTSAGLGQVIAALLAITAYRRRAWLERYATEEPADTEES